MQNTSALRRPLLECLDLPAASRGSSSIRMSVVCHHGMRLRASSTLVRHAASRRETGVLDALRLRPRRAGWATATPAARHLQTESSRSDSPKSSPAPPSSTSAPHLRSIRPAEPPLPINLPPHFGANQSAYPVPDQTKQLLARIVGHFRAVRWAVAYGSGVVGQKGYDAKGSKPLLDFLIATSHPSHFHSINLAAHPSHYPLFARWLGSDAIARIQEHWGAGVWYASMVEIEGQAIKYGVISTDALCEDLLDWRTVYVAGRMHKPVRIVRQDPRVLLANQVNLASVLRVALLSLPERFTERELWEEIAGISYRGDPRMSVPGGENPRKVQNIVKPNIARFRELYGRLLGELGGVRPADQAAADKAGETLGADASAQGWARLGLGINGGEGEIIQPTSPEHRAALLKKLPRNLKKALEYQFCKRLNVGVVPIGEEPGPHQMTEDDFWLRVAGEQALQKVLDDEIRRIIRYPAIAQTAKGFVTAGFRKSIVYASQKVKKWWKSRTLSS